ncbi:MAG: nicotinate-nucleotide adenylyltransferase [Cyanobacteria bacterium J06632_3]
MTSTLSPTPQSAPHNKLHIALFGTSADPPHLGHQSILLWLANTFDHVAVWAANNPYKEKQSPIHNRAEMLRLLIETLPVSGKVNLYQSLSDRYSIHSVALAQQRWPNAHFSFVVGADLLPQLTKWYRATELFKQVDLLVFPRPGYPIEGPALSRLQQLATVTIAHPPHQYDISSSTYRQIHRISHCEESNPKTAPAPPNKTFSQQTSTEPSQSHLPPVIRDYINEHDLYPCLQPTPKAKISTHR